MIRPVALPPPPWLLALVALSFVLPGLLGHDPWKGYDAIGIEIVHQMRLTGDWLVPRIAGEPWLEDPPLYHWFALAFAGATVSHTVAGEVAPGVSVTGKAKGSGPL